MPKAGKVKTTSLTKWDAELAALAEAAVATEAAVSSGNMISLKNGVMTYQGAEIPGAEFECIILDGIAHNAYYEDGFDPDTPTSPACYAFGRGEEPMAPHENAPNPQHDTCKGCPQNEFGTADRGRGKACANKRRIGLIAKSDLDEDILAAEVAYMQVPVTSVRAWAGYVRQINEVLKKPTLAVVTLIKVEKDPKTQFKVTVKMVEPIEDGELIGQLIQKAKLVQKEIAFPYVQIEAPAMPQRRERNVVPGKKNARGGGGGGGKTAAPRSKFA
jgi:hypothetical protein